MQGIIGDSYALLSAAIRSQHQAALSLLVEDLDNTSGNFVWLDFACGLGQIINQLETNVPDPDRRTRLQYVFFDAKDDYIQEVEKKAGALNLNSFHAELGVVSNAKRILEHRGPFQFISFTNTIHELDPIIVGEILVQLLSMLTDSGRLYVYDVSKLPDECLELGAVPWEDFEVKELIESIHRQFGQNACPMVQGWTHGTTQGWSVSLKKTHFDERVRTGSEEVFVATREIAGRIFEEKRKRFAATLRAFMKEGTETMEDRVILQDSLYRYWAIDQALRGELA